MGPGDAGTVAPGDQWTGRLDRGADPLCHRSPSHRSGRQPVIAVLGDGSFGFHMAEFDTAVRYGLPFVAVVGNDAAWNAEHQIQLRAYGQNRAHGCELLPTRYDLVAQGLGGSGELVTSAARAWAGLGAGARQRQAGLCQCDDRAPARPAFGAAGGTGACCQPSRQGGRALTFRSSDPVRCAEAIVDRAAPT